MFITITDINGGKVVLNKSQIVKVEVVKYRNYSKKGLKLTLSSKVIKKDLVDSFKGQYQYYEEQETITTQLMSSNKIDKFLAKFDPETPSLEDTIKEMRKEIDDLKEQLMYLPGHGDGYNEAKEDFEDLKEQA